MWVRSPDLQKRARGFTLLEMAMAMFVFALLVSAIFSIANGTTQLADETERSHERELESFSFARFCERTFRGLSGQSGVRLRIAKADRQYTSQLAILNPPPVLNGLSENGEIVLETQQNVDGYLRVFLRIVHSTDLNAYENSKQDIGDKLTLVDNVSHLEWKVYNPITDQWENVWNDTVSFVSPTMAAAPDNGIANGAVPPTAVVSPPGAAPSPPGSTVPPLPFPLATTNGVRPKLIELSFSIVGDSPRRFVFWVPPAETPMGTAIPGLPQAPQNPAANPAPPNGTVPATTPSITPGR